MAIIQISKIQQRAGNIVDLPQLDEAEFGWATDIKRLYIGKTSPNENIEVLTSYSNISFSQINGSFGNLNIDSANIANGQPLVYTGTEWTNRGGNLGGLINLGDVSNVKLGGGALSYVLETDGTGNLTWAPKTTIIAFIENVEPGNANIGTVTTTEDNFFVNGSEITITNVPGMTELDGGTFYTKILTSNTFELYDDSLLANGVNVSTFNAFSYTSVTDTFAGTDKISIGNTALVNVNDPIKFLGTLFGGLENDITYYITDIPDPGAPGNISVSLIEAGPNVSLLNGNGSANLYVTGGRAVSLVTGVSGGANGVAGGTDTMVQFNSSGILAGDSDFTYNSTAPKVLTLNANANVGNLNATGTVTGTRLISNVSIGTEPITVTSTTRVANLNVTSANIADFAGNVTVASQSNITSLGTLTTLNVNARVNATGYTSNVATGTAPLTVSSTTRVANLNVDYANVSDFGAVTLQTTGTFFPTFASSSATGNRALGANANLSFNAATGNLSTNILFANGNITGGNITTAGTGNIATLVVPTLANVTSTTAATTTTTGALQVAGGVGVAGNLIAGGNVVAGNMSTTGTANLATLVVPTLANVTSTTAATSTTTGALRVAGGAGIAGNIFVGGAINGNITSLTTGANTTAGTVTGNWTLTSGSRWNATYADLAEYYTSDENYQPGTVLEFGGEYEVTLGTNETNKVAGVVSTDPAFAMNAKCAGEHAVPIALQGRVPTKVVGAIRKGDMMISAGNGYATACSSPSLGTVIGKSLENFSGIEGVIEIAVGRL